MVWKDLVFKAYLSGQREEKSKGVEKGGGHIHFLGIYPVAGKSIRKGVLQKYLFVCLIVTQSSSQSKDAQGEGQSPLYPFWILPVVFRLLLNTRIAYHRAVDQTLE